jgi:hypothetical protein
MRRDRTLTGAALLTACMHAAPASAAPLGLRLEAGYNYSDNVTRAPQGSPDVLNDQFLGLSLGKTFAFPLTERTRVLVNGFVGGEKFLNYDGLSNVQYGAQGTWQFRPSGSYGAPTYSVFVRAAGEQFESTLRDGYRTSVGASIRKPLTDRIQVFTAATYNVRNATSTVFDLRDWSVRLNLDYTLFGRDTLYFGADYRRGDVVSTNRPSAALAGISKAFETDDAFDDGIVRTAYRFEAATIIGTIGYNFAFASGQSLDLAYRYVRSTPTETIVYPNYNWTQPTRYVDHQFGLAYLLRF